MATGIFGGEGFIMNKISGTGTVFLEIDGSAISYDLLPGQQMVIDTGYLAMMELHARWKFKALKGVKK